MENNYNAFLDDAVRRISEVVNEIVAENEAVFSADELRQQLIPLLLIRNAVLAYHAEDNEEDVMLLFRVLKFLKTCTNEALLFLYLRKANISTTDLLGYICVKEDKLFYLAFLKDLFR